MQKLVGFAPVVVVVHRQDRRRVNRSAETRSDAVARSRSRSRSDRHLGFQPRTGLLNRSKFWVRRWNSDANNKNIF